MSTVICCGLSLTRLKTAANFIPPRSCGFGKYEKGRLARVDKMHDFGFHSGPYWEVGLPGRNNTSTIVGYRREMSCR